MSVYWCISKNVPAEARYTYDLIHEDQVLNGRRWDDDLGKYIAFTPPKGFRFAKNLGMFDGTKWNRDIEEKISGFFGHLSHFVENEFMVFFPSSCDELRNLAPLMPFNPGSIG